MPQTRFSALLVATSAVIASLSSYAAPRLLERVAATRGRRGAAWLAASATAMGVGVWSMYFVGLLAHGAGVPAGYDVRILLLCVPVAVAASALTFLVAGRERVAAGGAAPTSRAEERAARESETRFRLATRATDDVIYDWDLRADALFWSEGLERVFGHAPERVQTGLAWWQDQLHPDDRPATLADLRATLATPADVWRGEYRLRRGDGSYALVLERGYIVRDEKGEPVRMIGALSDQSRHRALEEQLRQSQKMEAVGQLAGGVAHDFNNLLTVIKLHVELALEELDRAAPLRADLEEIGSAAARAAALTRQLLAFSRKQLLQPRVLDLNGVVTGMEPMLRRLLLGEGIGVRTHLAPTLGRVLADPGQLEQVLMNLAVNARDAMPDGGALTVETASVDVVRPGPPHPPGVSPGPYVSLAVSDTGSGMTREVQSRIFEPFFTTKSAGRGTGLGLATVYGIVTQSGGHISVESEPGRGSTFHLYLPRVTAHGAPPPAGAPPPRGAATVLVVEDEEAVRSLARRILERQGYDVLVARGGPEALALAARHAGPLDLVVAELIMPGLSGRALVEQLAAAHPGLRALFVSGYADDAIAQPGPGARGARVLQKPFTADALARAVREALAEPAASAPVSVR